MFLYIKNTVKKKNNLGEMHQECQKKTTRDTRVHLYIRSSSSWSPIWNFCRLPWNWQEQYLSPRSIRVKKVPLAAGWCRHDFFIHSNFRLYLFSFWRFSVVKGKKVSKIWFFLEFIKGHGQWLPLALEQPSQIEPLVLLTKPSHIWYRKPFDFHLVGFILFL